MTNRFAGVDTTKGFGIFIMILVHLFSQQIGQGDSSAVEPLLSQLNPFLIVIFLPVLVMGVWGSIFTLLTSLVITNQMFYHASVTPTILRKYSFTRILGGLLILIFYRLSRALLSIRNSESRYRVVYSIELVFSSDTLDSIVFMCILIPLLLSLLFHFPRLLTPKMFTGLFLGLGVLAMVLSIWFIPWGRELCSLFNQKQWYILEALLSKFVFGRFKFAHTFSFGCLGMILGYWMQRGINPKKLLKICGFFSLGTTLLFGISLLFDWTLVLQYANEDTPIIIQFFNMGGQLFLLTFFLRWLDFSTNGIKLRAGRLTNWLRRYATVSLTIFSIGRLVGDGLFWLFVRWRGDPIEYSSIGPFLAWNVWEMLLFLVTIILVWDLLLRLWEKLHFIGGIEWIIGLVFTVLHLKSSPALHASSKIYFYENLDPVPLVQSVPSLET